MTSKIILVGDVHGKFENFRKIVDDHPNYNIIQLGDFGFGNSWKALDYHYSPEQIKIVPGNHDDYDICLNSPFCLGDYGVYKCQDITFFYIRGGVSIDRTYREVERINGAQRTWWSSEEMSFVQMYQTLELYKKIRPDYLISHAAPTKIKDLIVGKNNKNDIVRKLGFDLNFQEATGDLLQMCIDFHQPKLHVFGHLHKSFDKTVNNTRFVCLPELQVFKV